MPWSILLISQNKIKVTESSLLLTAGQNHGLRLTSHTMVKVPESPTNLPPPAKDKVVTPESGAADIKKVA